MAEREDVTNHMELVKEMIKSSMKVCALPPLILLLILLFILLILLILILPILLINSTGPDRIAQLNFDGLLNLYETLNSLFFFVLMSYTVP